MTYDLFLDDERNPCDVTWIALPNVNWHVVRSYDQFVAVISERGVPAQVTFDHDLADMHYKAVANIKPQEDEKFKIWMPDDEGGLNISVDYGTEKTGYDCAKWLVDYCIENGVSFPAFYVHSMNPIGRKRIVDYITWAKERTGI